MKNLMDNNIITDDEELDDTMSDLDDMEEELTVDDNGDEIANAELSQGYDLDNDEFSPTFFNSIKDNSIDWFTGQTRVNITFSQRKWINKIKKLAEKYPNEVIIQNDYGDCINAKIPLKFIKIGAPRQVSDEQRERMREQAKKNMAEGKLFGRKVSN